MKGASLAMGLATTDGEEVVLVMFVTGDTGAVVVVRRTCRRLSTSSWNGSGWLILFYPSVLVWSSVKEADSDRWLEFNRWILLWSVESARSWWRWVISSMNKLSSMMRVMIDVPLFSLDLMDTPPFPGCWRHTRGDTGEHKWWSRAGKDTLEMRQKVGNQGM